MEFRLTLQQYDSLADQRHLFCQRLDTLKTMVLRA
ncbi:hypothetical protein Krac_1707 [Ktedonobacter racemifer DSM 44963]|uniref:Uncharacterized protein n=1 Tax=Ktedonobacter racemifer DSM 44963 TaxID=485913 RepID=D6U2S7_KTERA|nr:hypothetical protein Krac_1707 [Ktedonobacter racemifer DSM 44963]